MPGRDKWPSTTSVQQKLCHIVTLIVLIFLCIEKDMAWDECRAVSLCVLMVLMKLFSWRQSWWVVADIV